ncbi:AAA family ATPase [Chitinispirillales bacterium ANBcel5]|uniref:ParA family protein n=1 Tax=Cellulosispirillum alkaliphilum TaxID=3039283 RepID=UPI002A5795A3|nr:AAA family ATPase [Chitinispirillales bacterium ANBcel5]
MAIVISVINLKGGVAKTTTTVQLAECLSSEFSKKVLVVDLDPQTNATIALIKEENWEELDHSGQTLFQLFSDKLNNTKLFNVDTAIQKGVSNLNIRYLDLLPSSIRFIDIQDKISDIPDKTGYSINPMEVLKTTLHPYLDEYDYVLIDCPPNLGFITRNGIEISDYYLIPTIPDTLSTYGIPQIIKTINQFSLERPLKIKCLGLVITKFDSRSSSHERGLRNLPARFNIIFDNLGLPPSKIFDTKIPQANATAESMEFTNPVSTFKQKYGRGRSGCHYLYEYVLDLTREFMNYAKQ